MANNRLKVLRKVIKSTIEQVLEKHQLTQYSLISLSQIADLQSLGKLIKKLFILFIVELFLQVRWLLDIIVYLEL